MLWNIAYMFDDNDLTSGSHSLKASLLVLVSHLHGYRGLTGQSSAGEGDLRLDPGTLPVLQERSDWMEKQRQAQPVPQQVLS